MMPVRSARAIEALNRRACGNAAERSRVGTEYMSARGSTSDDAGTVLWVIIIKPGTISAPGMESR